MRNALILAAIGAAGTAANANLLVNPGFEDGLNGWLWFGNVFHETTNPPQFEPYEGDGVVSMFGNFTGGFNVTGIYQEFDAAPGTEWTLDVFSRHFSGDPLIGNGAPDANWVVQKIAFKDAADAEIGSVESTIMDGTFATDTWFDNAAITGVAPAGTVQVEAFVLYLQPLFDGGAVHIDNAYFIPTPGALATFAFAGLVATRRRR
jgi:hypothetical protein